MAPNLNKPNGGPMCSCEFCFNSYEPRAQVNNPRACNRKDCQRKRQRDNEKTWHNQPENKRTYDNKYHNIMKQKRLEILKKKALVMAKAVEVGCRFYHKEVCKEEIGKFLQQFFMIIGSRQINKFWLCPNIEELWTVMVAAGGENR